MTTSRNQLELIGFDEAMRRAEFEAGSPRELAILQRRVEKTFELIADDSHSQEEHLAFLHSGMCQTCLPHSRPANNHDVWQRTSGKFTLSVQPGIINQDTKDHGPETRNTKGTASYIGVPYGPKARLILIHLQSEGLKSRTVNLGASQSAFMRSLGLSCTGGARGSIAALKEQTLRLTRCNFVLQYNETPEHYQITEARITDGLEFWTSSSGKWVGVVELNERFHANLKEHAVPLDKRALAHLAGNSLGLDLYTFFAYRLPRLTKPLELNWSQLQAQVGADMALHRQLGARIREVLPDVLAAYPDARVEPTSRGLMLKPSPFAVPKTLVNGMRLATTADTVGPSKRKLATSQGALNVAGTKRR